MRFAFDENFNGHMLAGLISRLPNLDYIRVQDTNLYESPDDKLLASLAEQNRILITHDHHTMPGFVSDRVAVNLPMPGVIIVKQNMPIGLAIEDLEIMIETSDATEFENQVRYIPL